MSKLHIGWATPDAQHVLSQGQLRARRFRTDRHTGRVRRPKRGSFERVLAAVDAALLERVRWRCHLPVSGASLCYHRQIQDTEQ